MSNRLSYVSPRLFCSVPWLEWELTRPPSAPVSGTRSLQAVDLMINMEIGLVLSTNLDPEGGGVLDVDNELVKSQMYLDSVRRTVIVKEVKALLRLAPRLEEGPYAVLAGRKAASAFLSRPGKTFDPVVGLAIRMGEGCPSCSGVFLNPPTYRSHRSQQHPGSLLESLPVPFQRLLPHKSHPAFVVNTQPGVPLPIAPTSSQPAQPASASLLARRDTLQATRLPASLHPDPSNYIKSVFDQVLNYGRFLQPHSHTVLTSLSAKPHTYFPNAPTPLHLRDKLRNLGAHVEDYVCKADPVVEAYEGEYHVRRAIGKGDGRQGAQPGQAEDASLETTSDGMVFNARLKLGSLKSYAGLLTSLLATCLRTCPETYRPAEPLNPDGTAPPPTILPEPSNKAAFTESAHFPSFIFSELEVEATSKLRNAILADLSLQPDCSTGGEAGAATPVVTSAGMQTALLEFCTSIFCVYYEHEPTRGETMVDRFRMMLAMASGGGYKPARNVTPLLAQLEFAMRLTVLKGVAREGDPARGPVQARTAAEGPFVERRGVGSCLLDFVNAQPSSLNHTPFSAQRATVHAVWAAAAMEHVPPSIELVLSGEHKDELLPILVNKVHLSLTQVREVIQTLIRDIEEGITKLAPDVRLDDVGINFTSIPHRDPPVGKSPFDIPEVTAALGINSSEHDLFRLIGLPGWTGFINPLNAEAINPQASVRWRTTYALLVIKLVLLIQLSAPGARGTEFVEQGLTKTADFPSSLGFHSQSLTLTSYKNKNGRKTISPLWRLGLGLPGLGLWPPQALSEIFEDRKQKFMQSVMGEGIEC